MGKRMNWDKVRDQSRLRRVAKVKPLPMLEPEQFWALWHADKEAMKALGYRLKKIGNNWVVMVDVAN